VGLTEKKHGDDSFARRNKTGRGRQKREKAVALRYKSEKDSAPKVVAKGEGLVAKRILEVAREHGIPVSQNDDLVELLAQVELDREIPSELYGAVAEILSWIYRANESIKKEMT
jgi:flagellar biosynthesis protein